jgi:tetratricopeptide (TPR) repeat protein
MQMFDANIYALQGEVAYKEGHWAEAQTAVDIAIELDDRCAPAYLYRSALRIKQNDLAGALRDAETLLAMDKNSSDGLYLRACVAKVRGDLVAARADVQQALSNAPPGWGRRGEAQVMLDSLGAQPALPPGP